jgi:hypothetical protein
MGSDGSELSSPPPPPPAWLSGSHRPRFKGLTFEHATWLRPGLGDGFVEIQTGYCIVGPNATKTTVKTPGNVAFKHAVGITVRARPGRSSVLSVCHSKPGSYGAFAWARRALSSQ